MEEEGDKERGREIEPFELTEQSASSVSEKIHAYLKVCLWVTLCEEHMWGI